MEGILSGGILLPVVAAVIFAAFLIIRRRDYGKPKECEATLTAKQRQGDTLVFTFSRKDGGTVVCRTRESYYDKLEVGWQGMLAHNGKTLVDFERFGHS